MLVPFVYFCVFSGLNRHQRIDRALKTGKLHRDTLSKLILTSFIAILAGNAEVYFGE